MPFNTETSCKCICLRQMKTCIHIMSLQATGIKIHIHRNMNPKVETTQIPMNWRIDIVNKKCYACTEWYIIQAGLKWGYNSYTSIHRTWKSFAHWKKPDRIDHIFYAFYGQSRICECTEIKIYKQ